MGWFDRLATGAARMVSRAGFFSACVMMIVVWAASGFLFSDMDTWQLIINTGTTIVTFLLVALLQNTQARADKALQHKLNAIARAQLTILTFTICNTPRATRESLGDMANVAHELSCSIGLEDRESA